MNAALEQISSTMFDNNMDYTMAVREFRRAYITMILRRFKGNQSKAAIAMRMHRNSLVRALTDLNMDRGAVREMRSKDL